MGVEALAAFEDEGLDALDDRGALVADVAGGGMLEAGLLAACAEDGAEKVEADFFGDVELDEDEDGALESGGRGGGRRGGESRVGGFHI